MAEMKTYSKEELKNLSKQLKNDAHLLLIQPERQSKKACHRNETSMENHYEGFNKQDLIKYVMSKADGYYSDDFPIPYIEIWIEEYFDILLSKTALHRQCKTALHAK